MTFDPSQISSDAWEVYEITPHYRRSRLWIDREAGTWISRTEHLADEDIQALNAEERYARDGKRWGSGSGSEKGGNMPMIRLARTPLNKLMADAAPYMKQGDEDHMKWLLNSEAYAPFRTRSGKV